MISHTYSLIPASADVWLTVPAAWDAKGCDLMREAAIHAGLVHSSRAGDTQWRNRLHIITEPEAAAVHCAHLTDLHHLQPSQNFVVCDAGGGTVDLAVYKVCFLFVFKQILIIISPFKRLLDKWRIWKSQKSQPARGLTPEVSSWT